MSMKHFKNWINNKHGFGFHISDPVNDMELDNLKEERTHILTENKLKSETVYTYQ
jgi:hypothetical protein